MTARSTCAILVIYSWLLCFACLGNAAVESDLLDDLLVLMKGEKVTAMLVMENDYLMGKKKHFPNINSFHAKMYVVTYLLYFLV